MSPPEPRAADDSNPDALREAEAQSSSPEASDVPSLLALAKAHRARREMKACFDAYRAAAALGSAEAEFAVALFYMNGGVVPQDPKEGATRLRSAAEKGSIPARVYIGNLYELGVHYKADPEKADVWYRNAARASRVDDEPGSPEHVRALAELGCVRYVLALVEAGEVDGDEKARLLQRARAHGYGLRDKARSEAEDGARLTLTEALAGAGAVGDTPAPREADRTTPPPAQAAARASATTRPDAPRARGKRDSAATTRDGLASFGYALLFALAGLGAAYAATLGARELVSQGHSLPWLGVRTHLVFPIVLGVVGILPSWLVYKLGAVLKAIVVGAALGGVGWIAWGTGKGVLHGARDIQALAFGLAGFLAALLVLGLLGGSKLKPPSQRPKPG